MVFFSSSFSLALWMCYRLVFVFLSHSHSFIVRIEHPYKNVFNLNAKRLNVQPVSNVHIIFMLVNKQPRIFYREDEYTNKKAKKKKLDYIIVVITCFFFVHSSIFYRKNGLMWNANLCINFFLLLYFEELIIENDFQETRYNVLRTYRLWCYCVVTYICFVLTVKRTICKHRKALKVKIICLSGKDGQASE